MDFIGGIFAAIIGFFVLIVVLAIGTDIHQAGKLSDAPFNSEEEKAICMNDWHKSDSMRYLPVRCLKYYTGSTTPSL
jgi:hypothetical protein